MNNISQYRPPSSPPPAVTPIKPRDSYIIYCIYSYTYVWPKIGEPFWFYPTRVENEEVFGYGWTGRVWTFFGFDPDIIDQVTCYPVPTLCKMWKTK